jgi:exonuclease SbcC
VTRFLCVGDLHLEAGGDYGTQPGERLREQEDVWARALEIGRNAVADAILFAGDAFHKARPTPEAMLAFERPLVAHRAAGGAPVYAIVGNHDVASAATGTGLEVFAEAGLLTLARDPQIRSVAGVAIAFLPWAAAGRLVAAQGGGDRDDLNTLAADALVTVARGLRSMIEDCPAILLTHFSISGAVTPDGADVGLFREPVLDLRELEALGFDAIVAGHIHKPQMMSPGQLVEDAAGSHQAAGQPILYTGSPMPLNFGEAKSDHGVWILDLDDAGVGAHFVPIESRRFVTLDITAEDALGVQELDWEGCPAWVDVSDAVVKVRIAATAEQARRLDVGALKRALVAAGATKVWAVQTEVIREDRARVEGLDETLDELQALDLYLNARGINGSRGTALRERTQAYLEETRS